MAHAQKVAIPDGAQGVDSPQIAEVSPVENVQGVIEDASDWLLANKNADGGWGERKGSSSSPLNTAEAVLALVQGPKTAIVQRALKGGVDFILTHQMEEGGCTGAWCRMAGTVPIPDIVRTCFCSQALIRNGMGYDDPALRGALDWLSKLQRPDGGWSFSPTGKSALMPSILVLLTFLDLYAAGDLRYREPIEKGLEFVKQPERHFDDGSFSDNAPLTPAHTIYGALLFQSVGPCGLDPDAKKIEAKAVRWLIKHLRDAGKILEETYPIDSITEGRTGDYSFRYMTDALLLQVFSNSIDAQFRTGRHVEATLRSLGRRISPEGGFYGNRTTSWATARAIVGLASTGLAKFPEPTPPTSAEILVRMGGVLALAVLAIGSMVYLSVLSKFGVLQSSLLVFMMLSLLVALDVLTGGEFRTIVIAGFQGLSGEKAKTQ